MKYIAYYCLFYLLKQGAHIWYGSPGSLQIWTILGYAVLAIGCLIFPFKTELKIVWVSLLFLDAIAPLDPSNSVRLLCALLAAGWIASYMVRRFALKNPDVDIPWKVPK